MSVMSLAITNKSERFSGFKILQIHVFSLSAFTRAQPSRSCPVWNLAVSKKTSAVGKQGW